MTKLATLVSLSTVITASSFCVGYLLGIQLRKPLQPNIAPVKDIAANAEDSDDEDEDAADISALLVEPDDACKMVLVVRTDLGMTSGKIAAQCSHATLACFKALTTHHPQLLRQWESTGQAKIALRCSDEEELLTLQALAQSLNLCARSIQDAGRTQIEAGSRTVLGITGPTKLVNQVTGKLRLL